MHPDLSDPSLLATFNDVKNGNKNWVIYGYVPKTEKMRVDATGNGGLAEMTEEMSDGKVHYCFIRFNVNGTWKFVYIAWCGEGVAGMRKGSFTNHAIDMGKFLQGFHVQINARSESDLDETQLLSRLKTATSSHGRKNERSKVQGATNSGAEPAPAVAKAYSGIQHDLKAESDAYWAKQRAEEESQKETSFVPQRETQPSHSQSVGKQWEQRQQQAEVAPPPSRAAISSGTSTSRLAAAFNQPAPVAEPPKSKPAPPPAHHEPEPEVEEEQGEEEGYGQPPEEEAVPEVEESYAPAEESSDVSSGSTGGLQCRALYKYEGENEGDLLFEEGDLISVLDQSNPDGWWEGELHGVTGFFPSNFVQVL